MAFIYDMFFFISFYFFNDQKDLYTKIFEDKLLLERIAISFLGKKFLMATESTIIIYFLKLAGIMDIFESSWGAGGYETRFRVPKSERSTK